MRSALFAAIGLAFAAASVHAASSHFAVGKVQAVDPNAGTATIVHEPVASLKWPAMTMQFKVAGGAVLERLSKGGQVAFEFTGEDGNWRIVNAIPIAQSSTGAGSGDAHGRMHGGMGGGTHGGGGMMGGMSGMRDMCMDMMGGRSGR